MQWLGVGEGNVPIKPPTSCPAPVSFCPSRGALRQLWLPICEAITGGNGIVGVTVTPDPALSTR